MHFPALQAGLRSQCLAVTAVLLVVGCGEGTLAVSEAPAMPTAPAAQTNWTTYQDPVTGFSVRYPTNVAVMARRERWGAPVFTAEGRPARWCQTGELTPCRGPTKNGRSSIACE
jgi:hypothetical protein